MSWLFLTHFPHFLKHTLKKLRKHPSNLAIEKVNKKLSCSFKDEGKRICVIVDPILYYRHLYSIPPHFRVVATPAFIAPLFLFPSRCPQDFVPSLSTLPGSSSPLKDFPKKLRWNRLFLFFNRLSRRQK